MELTSELKKLGFTENEAKVYLALIKIGRSTAGPIIKEVGLHRNIVYSCLDKLIKRGLASETIQRGKKHFRPQDPGKILRSTKENVETAKRLILALHKIKEDQPQEITVYEGVEGFQNVHLDYVERMKANSTTYVVMAGGIKWYENMGKSYAKYERMRIEKNIKLKLLALESRREETLKLQGMRKLFRARFLPATFKNPIGTAIWGDAIMIMVYGAPILAIAIKSKIVATVYKKHFDNLWKIAKS